MDLNQVTKELDELFTQERMSEVPKFLETHIAQAKKEGAQDILLTLYNECIGFYRETGQYELSIENCQKAITLMDEMGLQETIPYATTLLNAANAYRAAGLLQDSLKLYNRVRPIYVAQLKEDDMYFAGLYNNLSLLYQEMGNFEAAKEQLENALHIVAHKPDAQFEIAVTQANLANTCIELTQDDEAKARAEEAIRIFEEIGVDDAHYSAALSALGSIYFMDKDYQNALEVMQKSRDCVEKYLGVDNIQYQRLSDNINIIKEKVEAANMPSSEEELEADTQANKDDEDAQDLQTKAQEDLDYIENKTEDNFSQEDEELDDASQNPANTQISEEDEQAYEETEEQQLNEEVQDENEQLYDEAKTEYEQSYEENEEEYEQSYEEIEDEQSYEEVEDEQPYEETEEEEAYEEIEDEQQSYEEVEDEQPYEEIEDEDQSYEEIEGAQLNEEVQGEYEQSYEEPEFELNQSDISENDSTKGIKQTLVRETNNFQESHDEIEEGKATVLDEENKTIDDMIAKVMDGIAEEVEKSADTKEDIQNTKSKNEMMVEKAVDIEEIDEYLSKDKEERLSEETKPENVENIQSEDINLEETNPEIMEMGTDNITDEETQENLTAEDENEEVTEEIMEKTTVEEMANAELTVEEMTNEENSIIEAPILEENLEDENIQTNASQDIIESENIDLKDDSLINKALDEGEKNEEQADTSDNNEEAESVEYENLTPEISGLELCRRYYEEFGKPMISEKFHAYEAVIAVGLVGKGSDCFGFDDIQSQDHDFGPRFIMWVTKKVYDEIGKELEEAYNELPSSFMGIDRIETVHGKDRAGVMIIEDFYKSVLGNDLIGSLVQHNIPSMSNVKGISTDTKLDKENLTTIKNWLAVHEYALAAAVNGEVFRDDEGIFTNYRNRLLDYYPKAVWFRKIANTCALFSQNGQYNLPRMRRRGQIVAAEMAKAECMKQAMKLYYLLNRKYAPHDKWLFKGMPQNQEMSIEDTNNELQDVASLIEKISILPVDKAHETELATSIELLAVIFANALEKQNIIGRCDLYLDTCTTELISKSDALLTAIVADTPVTTALSLSIAKVEFEAFDKVKNEGGRASCQNNWPTFKVMRMSQYMTWSEDMLLQYLYEFKANYARGRNMIEEKYARMMESTAPLDYVRFAHNLPTVSDAKKAIIEQIVALQVKWMEEFAAQYPNLAGNARSIHTTEDLPYDTSYETYLRGELSTYSDRMIDLYGRYIVEHAKNNKNVAYEIMENTIHFYGYSDLEDANAKNAKFYTREQ